MPDSTFWADRDDLLSRYKSTFKKTKDEDLIAKFNKGTQAFIRNLDSKKQAKSAEANAPTKPQKDNDSLLKNQISMMKRFIDSTKATSRQNHEKDFEVDDDRRESNRHLAEIVKLLKTLVKEDAPGLFGRNGLLGGLGGGLGRGKGGVLNSLRGKATSIEEAAMAAENEARVLEKPGLLRRIGSGLGNFGTRTLNKLGPVGTGLRLGGRGLGGIAKLGGRAISAVENFIPGLGLIVGGTQELGDLSDLQKQHGQKFLGDKKTGLLDSRAGGYGKSALNGAMIGGSVGAFLGPAGAGIGAGIGAVGGLGAAAYADYEPEVNKFVANMLSNGKAMVIKTWDGVTDLASKAYKKVVDAIPTWHGIQALAEKSVDSIFNPGTLIGRMSELFKGIMDWINDKIPTIDDLKNGIKNAGEAISTGVQTVGHAISHPIETAQKGATLVKEGVQTIGHAVSHPIETVKKIGTAVSNTATSAYQGIKGAASNAIQSVGKYTGMEAEKDYLKQALDEQGIVDPETRAGIAATIKGESGFKPKSETDYSHTKNSTIETTFKSALRGMSDEDVTKLKSDPKAFFDKVYGKTAGNKGGDDGYNYRGRGLIQLTGRGNYEKYGKMIGVDLIKNPDLANDPKVAAQIAAAYEKDRIKGSGFEAVKRSVGNAVGQTEGVKNKAFDEYSASGEFNSSPNGYANIKDKDKATMVADNKTTTPVATATDNKATMVAPDQTPTTRTPLVTAATDNQKVDNDGGTDNFLPAASSKTSKTINTASNTNNKIPANKSSGSYDSGNSGSDIDDIPMFVSDNGLIYVNSGMNV